MQRLQHVRRVNTTPTSTPTKRASLTSTYAMLDHGTLWVNPRTGEKGLVGPNKPSSWDGVVVLASNFLRLTSAGEMSTISTAPRILTVTGAPERWEISIGSTRRKIEGVPARADNGEVIYILDN